MADTLQTKACVALAEFLEPRLGVPVKSEWPQRDFRAPVNIVTITTAGARRDTPVDLGIVKKVLNGTYNVDSTWLLASCEQPLALDVWSSNEVDRDDILVKLDDVLHLGDSTLATSWCATPAGNGILLQLDSESTVDYDFGRPEVEYSSDDEAREIFRATYLGTAYFMLTVTRTTPRQKVIELVQQINDTDFP